MAITDKARRVQRAALSQRDSQSSTLVVVSPVVQRLRSVLTELQTFVGNNGDEHQRRMSRLLGVVIDEAMEEMGETDSRVLAGWMHMMACVIEWTATGNLEVLPDELKGFAANLPGQPMEQATSAEPEVVDAEIIG